MSTGATHIAYTAFSLNQTPSSPQHDEEYWTSAIQASASLSFAQLSQQAAQLSQQAASEDEFHRFCDEYGVDPNASLDGKDEDWESDEDCDEDPPVEAASLPEINFSGPPPSGPSIANVFNTTPAGYKVTQTGPTTLKFSPYY